MDSLLGIIGGIAKSVASHFFPNPEDELKRQELQQQFQLAVLENEKQITLAAGETVRAEIQGKSVLQRNWRPILMLTFGALIVARWLGWSAPDLSQPEALELWSIVKLGLGGYVIGRSAEKIAPAVINAAKK